MADFEKELRVVGGRSRSNRIDLWCCLFLIVAKGSLQWPRREAGGPFLSCISRTIAGASVVVSRRSTRAKEERGRRLKPAGCFLQNGWAPPKTSFCLQLVYDSCPVRCGRKALAGRPCSESQPSKAGPSHAFRCGRSSLLTLSLASACLTLRALLLLLTYLRHDPPTAHHHPTQHRHRDGACGRGRRCSGPALLIAAAAGLFAAARLSTRTPLPAASATRVVDVVVAPGGGARGGGRGAQPHHLVLQRPAAPVRDGLHQLPPPELPAKGACGPWADCVVCACHGGQAGGRQKSICGNIEVGRTKARRGGRVKGARGGGVGGGMGTDEGRGSVLAALGRLPGAGWLARPASLAPLARSPALITPRASPPVAAIDRSIDRIE